MMTFAHAKEANSRTFARETTSLKSTNQQFSHLVQKRTSSVNLSVYMDHSAYVTARNHPRTATEYKLCLKIFGYLMVVRVCYIQPLCQRIPSYS